MGLIKTTKDIEKIREGGRLIADILRRTVKMAQPGVSTFALNAFAEKEIIKIGGRPSFKGYGPKGHEFPAGLCTSINSVIVHGMPSKKDILKEGDIVGLDIGMEYKGRYTDHAVTVAVGKISKEAQKLLDVTSHALDLAIKQAKVGNKVGDISSAIQIWVEKNGFNVARNLVGHGVGFAVHEPPHVPCYGKPDTGPELKAGMVLAIEPMVMAGSAELGLDSDNWGFLTVDGSLTAHFEHTVAITKKGPEVLTI